MLNLNGKIKRMIGVATLLFALTGLGCAQNTNTKATADRPDFAPLEQWKSAVLAGNGPGLKMFYSENPVPKLTSAAGDSNAEGEVDFWLHAKAQNLTLEIAQTSEPQPGLRRIVFQAEVTTAASSGAQTLYVKEGQTWQKQADGWRIVEVQRSDAAHLKQLFAKEKNIYPPDADAHAEIREAEQEALKEHKRVLLVFGANWCYDCHVLDLAFHRPDLAPAVANYEVVHVDIGTDGKKNSDLAKQFQVPMDKGVPALAVVDGDGKLIVSQKNGEFENARALTPEALLEFLNKWKLESR
jgi:thioredoxin 1